MTWHAFFKTPPMRNGLIAGAVSTVSGSAVSIVGSFMVSDLCQDLVHDGEEAFNQTMTIRSAPGLAFPSSWSERLAQSDLSTYCLAVSMGISLGLTLAFSLALFAVVAITTHLRAQQQEELTFHDLDDLSAGFGRYSITR